MATFLSNEILLIYGRRLFNFGLELGMNGPTDCFFVLLINKTVYLNLGSYCRTKKIFELWRHYLVYVDPEVVYSIGLHGNFV